MRFFRKKPVTRWKPGAVRLEDLPVLRDGDVCTVSSETVITHEREGRTMAKLVATVKSMKSIKEGFRVTCDVELPEGSFGVRRIIFDFEDAASAVSLDLLPGQDVHVDIGD